MKPKLPFVGMLLFIGIALHAQRLVARMVDICATDAENLAVIQCYTDGIGTFAEVMTIFPWFLEAAGIPNGNPGLDVGIHVAYNSDWACYKNIRLVLSAT